MEQPCWFRIQTQQLSFDSFIFVFQSYTGTKIKSGRTIIWYSYAFIITNCSSVIKQIPNLISFHPKQTHLNLIRIRILNYSMIINFIPICNSSLHESRWGIPILCKNESSMKSPLHVTPEIYRPGFSAAAPRFTEMHLSRSDKFIFFSLQIYPLILSLSHNILAHVPAPHCRPFQNNNAFHNNSKIVRISFTILRHSQMTVSMLAGVHHTQCESARVLTAKCCNRNLNGNRKKQQLLNETPNDVNRKKKLIKRYSSDA